jgi:HD-GYP domain-containing protein (c-di-GMP phosphodiesterase class II)
MSQKEQQFYIPIRRSQINYYKKVELYYKTAENSFALYKPSGKMVADLRINERRHPKLYFSQEDRLDVIQELQKEFNQHIAKSIEIGDVVEVKSTLCDLVEETLAEPRSGTLQALPETVDSLVSGYSNHPDILKTFASISMKDYTTVIHSVNVMALTIGFCFHTNYSLKDTKRMGLSALLHDVGKTEIPLKILKAPRKLTDREFDIMKLHPKVGGNIIRQKSGIADEISKGVLEHHEKLDGSGYPEGIREISFEGQLLGIIDCYEALTNEERPYRRAKMPLETLKFLKSDVETGKFNRKIFEKFCYSLI